MAEKLRLTTAPVRRTVEIDGKDYELLDRQELSLEEGLAFDEVFSSVTEMFKSRNPEKTQEVRESVSRVCARVMPGCPPEVLAKLGDWQKIQIVTLFLTPRDTPAPGEPQKPAAAERP